MLWLTREVCRPKSGQCVVTRAANITSEVIDIPSIVTRTVSYGRRRHRSVFSRSFLVPVLLLLYVPRCMLISRYSRLIVIDSLHSGAIPLLVIRTRFSLFQKRVANCRVPSFFHFVSAFSFVIAIDAMRLCDIGIVCIFVCVQLFPWMCINIYSACCFWNSNVGA